MKTALLTLILFISTTVTYGQFAPIGAQWHYGASGGGMAPGNSEYYHYQSERDTVVDGHSCKKIAITYYKYKGGIENPSPVFVYQENDTVFYYNDIYARYFPLYIFNVLVDDTLTFHTPVPPIIPGDTLWQTIVDSVTPFDAGGTVLQRVWTHEPYSTPFSMWGGYMERIGSTMLMLHQPSIVFPEWDGPLRCYSDSTVSYKFTSGTCDFRLISGINETENAFGLLVFPNPASNELNIRTQYNSKAGFSIYNALGQLVQQGVLESNTTTIYINELAGGLYSIELSADNKRERKSFVVER